MGFNRNNLNLGNQFAHAAAVSRGDERENSSRSRDYFKIPQGFGRHKWTAEKERFNVLLAKNNASDPDDTGYKFYKSVQVHELPNMTDPKHPHLYPCLHIIGKPCPVCDRKEQLDDGTKGGENWDRIKPYLPKDRVLYYLNPEGTDKILVHECAARQKGDAAFPQRLMAQATAMSEGTTPIPFASPTEEGRIVQVNTSKDNFNGNEFYSPSAVNFFQRKELPADELYERCIPWNELLNFGTPEEMQRVMDGGEPDPYTASASQTSAPVHTEEQKQAEFQRACEESVPQNNGFQQQAAPVSQFNPPQQVNGFQTSPANGPLSEADFQRDPYSAPSRQFPSEQTHPQGQCPSGLRFGMDYETSRKCCNCTARDACLNARRNGN